MKTYIFAILAFLAAPMAWAQGSYQVQPGDVLSITVLEDTNLNRQALVRPDGGISLPIAGNILAAGNTISGIERVIRERLAPGFSVTPTVSVALTQLGQVEEEELINVFVVGEAGRTGAVPVESGTTLLQAIASAGGPTAFAATKRIQLRRVDASGAETIFLFNYRAAERGTRITNNLVVQEGDVILFPERRLFE